MACRPQSNPTITSFDGVPPELAVLDFQRTPACTGQTGRRYRSDRSAQGFAGVDHFDDRSRILTHSSVLMRFCVNRYQFYQGTPDVRIGGKHGDDSGPDAGTDGNSRDLFFVCLFPSFRAANDSAAGSLSR